MLNFFYKYTLIVSRTTNINIYLKFRIFDAMFNYLEHLKKTIEINVCFLIEIVTKLAKYCLKTKEFDNTLYNLVNILYSKQKLSFYKM